MFSHLHLCVCVCGLQLFCVAYITCVLQYFIDQGERVQVVCICVNGIFVTEFLEHTF